MVVRSTGWGAEPLLSQASDNDERSPHQAVTEAMRVIGFSEEEVGSVHRILAAILHLVSLAARLGPRPHPWLCPCIPSLCLSKDVQALGKHGA